jgi:hypothetical protein
MAEPRHIVLGVHITDRVHHAHQVQDLFTKYGCSIKTRIGLHGVAQGYCSPNGLVLLEMAGDETPVFEMIEKLKAVEGVDIQTMIFEHD